MQKPHLRVGADPAAGRVRLPWQPGPALPAMAGLRALLVENDPAGGEQVLAEWQFEPPLGHLAGLELELSRLDLQSVRLATATGPRLASSFQLHHQPWAVRSLALQLRSEGHPGPGLVQIFRLDSAAPAIQGGWQRQLVAETPAIEWFFVELTNHCNYHCQWCPSRLMQRPRGFMPLERFTRLIDQIKEYRRRWPLWSLYAELNHPVFLHVMGEPLLHPELFDMVAAATSRGVDLCLVTNGSLLDEPTIGKVLDSGLRSMVLGINAPDAGCFRLTGAPITYEQVLDRVGLLLKHRARRGQVLPRIEIQLLNTAPVELNNARAVEHTSQVEEQLILWTDLVRQAVAGYPEQLPHAATDNLRHWPQALRFPTNDPRSYYQLARQVWLVFKQACTFANLLVPEHLVARPSSHGSCPLQCQQRMLCIYWDGSTSFCSLDHESSMQLGNVFEQSIESIWSSPRMRRLRHLMAHEIVSEPICRRCLGSLHQRVPQPAGQRGAP